MGQVFYREWTPSEFDPTYNQNGALPQLESVTPNVPKELPHQPQHYYDNRLGVPSFYLANIQDGYTIDTKIFYPVGDDAYRFAPEQPVRRDVFAQLSQRVTPAYVAGQAPTKGVYTCIPDLGYE